MYKQSERITPIMPRVKQFNIEEVLKKAMELFWRKGYHATSVQDLVDELKINRASLYDTFGGKKALFDRALDLYMESNRTRIKTFLEEVDDPVQAIEQLLRQAIREAITDREQKGCFVVNATTELAANDALLQSRLKNNQELFIQNIKYALLKGQTAGKISPEKDLEAIATSLFVLYSGLRVVSKAYLSEKHLEKSIAPILAMLD